MASQNIDREALGRGADLEEDEGDDLRCVGIAPVRQQHPRRRCHRRRHHRRLPHCLLPRFHRPGEEARRQAAFEREYEDDHSWEDLEEDEFGNLRAPVRPVFKFGRRRRRQ